MLYIDDSAGGHRLFGLSVWMQNAMMLDLEILGFSLSAKGSLLPFPQLEFLGMLAGDYRANRCGGGHASCA